MRQLIQPRTITARITVNDVVPDNYLGPQEERERRELRQTLSFDFPPTMGNQEILMKLAFKLDQVAASCDALADFAPDASTLFGPGGTFDADGHRPCKWTLCRTLNSKDGQVVRVRMEAQH